MHRCARRTTPGLAALLLFLAIVTVAPVAAQSPEAPIGTFHEETQVAWVLVPVGVQVGDRWVGDLERRHFRLSVDGEPVAFTDFDGADAAVSLVFLQDLSGSMANGGKLAASRAALAELIGDAAPADELALASFAGGQIAVDVPFTRDESVLAEAMDLWQAYGTTMLHDAVAWIPEIAFEGRHPKRAVVLVTDGVDNASRLAPEVARDVVRRARLPVFVLGLGREDLAATAGDIARGGAATYGELLQRLSLATGGRYLPIRHAADATAVARDLLDELRHQYILAFPTAPGAAAERLLSVSVERAGATVYHRRAYFGGPPL